MEIGVIGTGFVGTCVLRSFSKKFNVSSYDKKNLGSKIENILKSDICFICVPTPTEDGEQDLSIIESIYKQLEFFEYKGITVIKSTVIPGTCTFLEDTYGIPIVHNPEFLREATAQADFDYQKNILLSGDYELTEIVAEAYRDVFPQAFLYIYLDHEVTEIAKYIHNVFLASKVEFFNNIFDVCSKIGINYKSCVEAALSQEKILPNHTNVPGSDGSRGFGGTCFPKDTSAFLSFCKTIGIEFPMLKSVIESNKLRRNDVL